MKFEIEITDKQIQEAINLMFVNKFGQEMPITKAIREVAEKEIAKQLDESQLKPFLQKIIAEKIESVATERVVSATRHIIREVVKGMSDTEELALLVKSALEKNDAK